jgi:hypothetical protein
MAYRKDWAQPQQGEGFARTMKTLGRTVAISVADNVTGNTIGAFLLPAGFTVTGILGSATDMDTGGPAMLITVGDAANASRYVASVSAGAAIASWTLAAAGFLFKNTVDTEVLITIATQAATPAAGTATIYLTGFMDK